LIVQHLPPVTVDEPLLPWLVRILQPMSRTKVKEWLRDGRIHVNGTSTTQHDYLLSPGDRVSVGEPTRSLFASELERAGITIVHEDDAIVVIDKPAGLLTVATEAEKADTAFACMLAYSERLVKPRPFVVHRLDRDTSGLLLFARSPTARERLQATWDTVTKTYLAVTASVPRPPSGTVDNYLLEGRDLRVRSTRSDTLGAKRAISRYRVLSELGGYALVEVVIETGRKHQIRVHLAGLGCPIIGDRTYGSTHDPVGRLGLHAHQLAFNHPITGNRITLESSLPATLRRVMGL